MKADSPHQFFIIFYYYNYYRTVHDSIIYISFKIIISLSQQFNAKHLTSELLSGCDNSAARHTHTLKYYYQCLGSLELPQLLVYVLNRRLLEITHSIFIISDCIITNDLYPRFYYDVRLTITVPCNCYISYSSNSLINISHQRCIVVVTIIVTGCIFNYSINVGCFSNMIEVLFIFIIRYL